MVAKPLDWDGEPLYYRWGAPERLCGILVFYDFQWRDVFPDHRTHFRRGQVLARTVIDRCPSGLTPALLLTRRDDVEQGFVSTETYSLFVLNIDEWLNTPDNPALAYLANHLSVDPRELGGFAQLSELGGADEVRAFVERQLDVEHVAGWLEQDPARMQRLAELVDVGHTHPATVKQALDALGALGGLDEEGVQRLIEFVLKVTDDAQRADLIRHATATKEGREVTGEVLSERIEDRLEDARRDLAGYRALLVKPKATETDMQRYLAEHPLLFGLQYARIRPQLRGPSGSMDFILERLDGYNDLVELKGPSDKIIKAPRHEAGAPVPSPHSYKLSAGLSQALAQALAYRDRLTRYASAAEELGGIRNAREPRLLIVLGRLTSLEEHQRQVLLELNRSLHRVQIIPYDQIADKAQTTLDNIAKYLEHAPNDPR
ncbi:Shedu anti-phage system protein SduA domain-containing protein [Nocardioides dilutus]